MKTEPIPLSRLERYTQNARDRTAYHKADRDVPIPEDVKVHREHELTPLSKKKGGVSVLRLRTMTHGQSRVEVGLGA